MIGEQKNFLCHTSGTGELIVKGPPPLPTHLKVVSGNRGKRPLNKAEPKPETRIPKPPEELSAEALEEWKRIAPLLLAAGMITVIDRAALAAYCQSYGRWAQAERALAAGELVIKTVRGNLVYNPLVRIANKAMADMVRFAAEFGMTPSGRSRVKVSDKQASAADSFFAS
jgi:P27 family predicted phage terminase small subunit